VPLPVPTLASPPSTTTGAASGADPLPTRSVADAPPAVPRAPDAPGAAATPQPANAPDAPLAAPAPPTPPDAPGASAPEERHVALTPSQGRLLAMLATMPGARSSQLAGALGIQRSTVRDGLMRIRRAFGIGQDEDIVAVARARGVLPPATAGGAATEAIGDAVAGEGG